MKKGIIFILVLMFTVSWAFAEKGAPIQYDPADYPAPTRQGGETVDDATVIGSLPYNDVGETTGFVDDYDEVCPYTGSTSPDVVYSYTPTVDVINGFVSLCGDTDYDSKLYIYENTVTPGAPFACVDDVCTSALGQSYVSEITDLNFVGGNTYYIVVDGYGGASGGYEIDVTGEMSVYGTIEGTVYLDGGTGDVEDAVVSAGGVTTNPAADGTYSLEVMVGTYDVTALLGGYESDLVEDVVVTEGNITSGVDLTLVYVPATLDPVENLAVDASTGLLTWEAPGGELYELIQHDGNPLNGYFQAFDTGYGVVYDVSGYTDVTVEMVDFRHSSWGLTGIWDYTLHIVDWDTYTEIGTVSGLQTTVNDDWELEIDLGSVSASGFVGIFLEPQGNTAADAYPDLDSDDVGPDGMSYYGPLADYAGMGLSGIGDFLMDLWIMGDATDGIVKAKKFVANFGNGISRVESTIPEVDFLTLNQTSVTRDLLGFNVYLDGVLQGNTTDLEYLLSGLVNGEEYTAGVEAVYDEGESDIIEITFTYTGGSEVGNVIVAATELKDNYPNPFNPETTIAYSTKDAGNVTLEVYNLRGQLVKTLVNEVKQTGNYTVIWDGTDDSYKAVSSGVYFYKMVSEGNIGRYTSTKKMILMK